MTPDGGDGCVIITGAAGDIGRANALRLAPDGVASIGLVILSRPDLSRLGANSSASHRRR